jgi:hypothetical protein
MKNMFRSLLLFCLLLAGSFAQAQLLLNVDTTNQYIWFTGSLTGTSGPLFYGETNGGGFGFLTNQGTKTVSNLMLDEGGWGAFHSMSGLTSASPNFLGVSFGSRPDPGLQMFVLFFYTDSQDVPMTINGGGLDYKMNYASGALNYAAAEIEGMIGTRMEYWYANTGGSVIVQAASISTVPEPSTLLLFGVGLLAMLRHLNQKSVRGYYHPPKTHLESYRKLTEKLTGHSC